MSSNRRRLKEDVGVRIEFQVGKKLSLGGRCSEASMHWLFEHGRTTFLNDILSRIKFKVAPSKDIGAPNELFSFQCSISSAITNSKLSCLHTLKGVDLFNFSTSYAKAYWSSTTQMSLSKVNLVADLSIERISRVRFAKQKMKTNLKCGGKLDWMRRSILQEDGVD